MAFEELKISNQVQNCVWVTQVKIVQETCVKMGQNYHCMNIILYQDFHILST